jgi:hypothetical protein
VISKLNSGAGWRGQESARLAFSVPGAVGVLGAVGVVLGESSSAGYCSPLLHKSRADSVPGLVGNDGVTGVRYSHSIVLGGLLEIS